MAARYATGKDDKELSAPISLSDSRHRLAAVAGTSTCHVIHVGQVSSRRVWMTLE